jgi:hypothetical protein
MLRSLASSLSSSDASSWEESCIWLAIISGIVLVFGLIGEWPESDHWKTSCLYKLAKAAVILGVARELFGDAGIFATSGRLQQITDDSIRENFRIEKVVIEQLKPRDFTKPQFDTLVASLRGKIKGRLPIFSDPDAESRRFGFAISQLFKEAQIDAPFFFLSSSPSVMGISSVGVTLYVPGANSNAELKTLTETLFNGAIVNGGLVIHGYSGEATSGVPIPSLFVMPKQYPFDWIQGYLEPPGSPWPKPPWEPK